MSNSKVLLFGSFTEDETKSLRVKKSSGRNDKPVDKNQLQFGSLNSVTVDSNDLPNSPKAPKNVPLPDSQKLNGVNGVSTNLPKVSETIKENGSITKFSPSPSGIISATSVKEHHMSSVTLLDGNGTTNHFANLSMDASETDSLKNGLKNGSGDDTSKLFDQDLKKAPNGHAKELLPRGLINSGNLCFLSATVQALLVCSPFVQLLQELRTRNIPKVGYPTLKAFAEFVTQFDRPNGIKLNSLASIPKDVQSNSSSNQDLRGL